MSSACEPRDQEGRKTSRKGATETWAGDPRRARQDEFPWSDVSRLRSLSEPPASLGVARRSLGEGGRGVEPALRRGEAGGQRKPLRRGEAGTTADIARQLGAQSYSNAYAAGDLLLGFGHLQNARAFEIRISEQPALEEDDLASRVAG